MSPTQIPLQRYKIVLGYLAHTPFRFILNIVPCYSIIRCRMVVNLLNCRRQFGIEADRLTQYD